MNYPQPLKNRELNNPRLGIKSSLPSPRKLIALLYLIYINNDRKASVNYLIDSSSFLSNATIEENLASNIINSIGETNDFINIILNNPLVSSQIEALQVAIQLFFRLGRINFTTPGQSESIERTGGKRYPKKIDFSTNIDIIDLFLNRFADSERNNFLKCWLKDEDDDLISPLMKRLLVTFVEPTIFRITETDEKILDFDLLGIYDSFLNKGMNDVDYKGIVELKGTTRVLDSFLRNGLHPYILHDKGLADVNPDTRGELREYAKRVDTSLSIAPKLDDYPFDLEMAESKDILDTFNAEPRQVIYFGAPGTGKSHEVNKIVKDKRHIRTTFHPDTDYSSFVGCYKPTMNDGKIEYAFRGQAFVNAYISAWKNTTLPFYLVIEEINRGNCAQIFGDIFQLLDRDLSGASTYGIVPDTDLKAYIAENLADIEGIPDDIKNGDEMCLPSNLFIYATMNTSDQSLFPIDSAFKRRWDMRYTAIKPGEKEHILAVGGFYYKWSSFISKVNDKIWDLTKSEDKQLGYWFIKPNEKRILDWKLFVSKVIFYIWNDVVKDYATAEKEESPFGKKYAFSTFFDANGNAIKEHVVEYLDALEVEKIYIKDEPDPDELSKYLDESGSDDGDDSKDGKDFTKYQINGSGKYDKKHLATELVRRYIDSNPDMSASQVIEEWKQLGNIVSHFIESQEEFERRTDDNPRVNTIECNGEPIYISTNGWGGTNKMKELKDAVESKDWNLKITEYRR